MEEHRSILGLDKEQSFLEKLGQFLAARLLGPLVGLLLFAGIQTLDGAWRSIALICCEVLAVFWACLLVFIWWRPPWFRRLYVSAERKAVLLVRIAVLVMLVSLAILLFGGCLRAFRM